MCLSNSLLTVDVQLFFSFFLFLAVWLQVHSFSAVNGHTPKSSFLTATYRKSKGKWDHWVKTQDWLNPPTLQSILLSDVAPSRLKLSWTYSEPHSVKSQPLGLGGVTCGCSLVQLPILQTFQSYGYKYVKR